MAEEIEKRVDDAFRELEEKGDSEKALHRLEHLPEEVAHAFDHGEIASEEVATDLLSAIQALQAAIVAAG